MKAVFTHYGTVLEVNIPKKPGTCASPFNEENWRFVFVVVVFVFVCFQDSIIDCPGTQSVDQAGLKFTEI